MTKTTKEYRTQEQFDEIAGSLINGNFYQAVDQVIEYGFYAQDLRAFVDNTEWCSGHNYFDNEDFYQVIETATQKRTEKEYLQNRRIKKWKTF